MIYTSNVYILMNVLLRNPAKFDPDIYEGLYIHVMVF